MYLAMNLAQRIIVITEHEGNCFLFHRYTDFKMWISIKSGTFIILKNSKIGSLLERGSEKVNILTAFVWRV